MLVWPPEAAMHRTLDRQIWKLSYLGLRRMDALIAPSEFSRQMLMRHLGIPAERVFTIHSGVDAETFHPRPDGRARLLDRYRLPAADDDRYVLYVGTEIPRKNLATLLRSLARLPVGVRLLKVGAAGHPRFRRATERLVRELSLEDRVILVGEVADEDLALLYAGADCYVCCSFLEGFGQPVLEAMACGAPVICSDVSSLPEIAADAAILVPPADASRLAEAIRSVLDDPALGATLRARGLQRSRDFSWQKTADAVVDVYERLFDGRVP
jgi:glycosyltransferase involved in cell wall biosynthesis